MKKNIKIFLIFTLIILRVRLDDTSSIKPINDETHGNDKSSNLPKKRENSEIKTNQNKIPIIPVEEKEKEKENNNHVTIVEEKKKNNNDIKAVRIEKKDKNQFTALEKKNENKVPITNEVNKEKKSIPVIPIIPVTSVKNKETEKLPVTTNQKEVENITNQKNKNTDETNKSEESKNINKKEVTQFAQHQNKNVGVTEETKKSAKLDKNKLEVVLDKTYELEKTGKYNILENIDLTKMLIINIKGIGTVNTVIKDINSKEILNTNFEINMTHTKHIIPISSQILEKAKGGRIIFKNSGFLKFLNLFITINLKKSIDINFNDSLKITSKFIRKIQFKVLHPELNLDKNKKNRIQFIMQTTLENQDIKGDEGVEMYINTKKEFPNAKNHEISASGNLGKGLIKTLNKKNKYYCIKKDCEYYVTLILENIDTAYFFPTIYSEMSEISFHKNLNLIEELEKNEEITYIIKIPSNEINWLFSIHPTTKDASFYINPEEKPSSLKNYRYKAENEGDENLIVTSKELTGSFNNLSKLYVTFKSKDGSKASAFTFKAKKYEEEKNIDINEDIWESGVLNSDEIVNYKLDLNSTNKELYTLNFKLISYTGYSEIFVKECDIDQRDCTVRKKDINDSYLPANLVLNNGKIFRYQRKNIIQNGKKVQEMMVNFNCMNGDKKNNNKYPISKSCKFAVAVHNKSNNEKTNYSLIITGQEIPKELFLSQSVSTTLSENTRQLLELHILPMDMEKMKTVNFKIVSLTGSCNIYISKDNPNPNSDDFDAKIEFERKGVKSLHTILKNIFLTLDNTIKNKIYILVESLTYSIIDIYPSLSKLLIPGEPEYLKLGNLVSRVIKRENNFHNKKDFIYFENFVLDIPKDHQKNESLDITLNSNILGLEICVQKDKNKVDYNYGCDFKSDSEILEIIDMRNNLSMVKKLAIQIRKRIRKTELFTRFPINFSIVINSSFLSSVSFSKIKMTTPGQIFSKKMMSSSHQVYQLDFKNIENKGFISFTTEDPKISAHILNKFTSIEELSLKLGTLDHINFSFVINDAFSFETKYWDEGKYIYVLVMNSGNKKGRYNLLYSYDYLPIHLKEGNSIFIPSHLDNYFLSDVDKNEEYYCDFDSETSKFETFSKVFNTVTLENYPLTKMLTEERFEFKTNIKTHADIIIPISSINNFSNPMIGILYKAKQNKIYSNGLYSIYNQENRTIISSHSKIKKLQPNQDEKDIAMKGEFKYYYFTIDESDNYLISLSIKSGESDLYINKGMYNYTTTDNYWLKSGNNKGNEIEITPDMFDDEFGIIGVYTVGVYSREFSSFSVVMSPDFGNVYNIMYQHLFDIEMKPEKYYYLNFFNKKSAFNTILYSKKSNIDVSAFNYSQNQEEDFMDLLKKDSNYVQTFTFHKGDPPREVRIDDVKNKKKNHYIIRLKADKLTNFFFCIYDKNSPIEIYSSKRFDFILNTDEEQTFVVRLDNDYQDINVDIKLEFGDIQFSVNDDQIKLDENLNHLDRPDQQYVSFYSEKSTKKSDIVIFKEIFIKVKSKKLSYFSMLLKPKNKFKKIRDFETELIYTSSENDQFIYYEVKKKDIPKLHSLIFNISMVNNIKIKPDLFFVSDSDVTLNSKTPFLPMPLIDYSQKEINQFSNILIRPMITPGSYIIKINKNSSKVPIKINVSLNHKKNIQLNGIQTDFMPLNKAGRHYYTMYIPEPGEVRILLEACNSVQISNSRFKTKDDDNEIDFQNQYYEIYPFVNIDYTTLSQNVNVEKMRVNLKRVVLDKPGIIKFSVELDDGYRGSDFMLKSDHFYDLITEYKPARKELILKDYLEMANDEKRFSSDYNIEKGILAITSKAPKFKQQLLVDYPNLKKIKVEFFIYIFDNSEKLFLKSLNKCGFSFIENKKKGKIVRRKEVLIILIDAINGGDLESVSVFKKNDLAFFKDLNKISIFEKLEITFIETENDEFNITLDKLFTTIPYFLITIPNQNRSIITRRFLKYLLIFVTVFSAIILVFYLFCKKDDDMIEVKQYVPKRHVGKINKLEMVNVNEKNYQNNEKNTLKEEKIDEYEEI